MIHLGLKARHFIPDAHYESIYDIDFETLGKDGVTTLLLDLDNTLISYDDTLAGEELSRFLAGLKEQGFKRVVISNSRQRRLSTFCDPLALDYVAFAKKPFRSGFKKALSIAGSTKEESVLIGDQLMTDVYGAKRFGIRVLLVKPIKKRTEKWYTRFNRRLEQKMLRKIEKKHPERFRSLRLDDRA